jgi:hypothetical protein
MHDVSTCGSNERRIVELNPSVNSAVTRVAIEIDLYALDDRVDVAVGEVNDIACDRRASNHHATVEHSAVILAAGRSDLCAVEFDGPAAGDCQRPHVKRGVVVHVGRSVVTRLVEARIVEVGFP